MKFLTLKFLFRHPEVEKHVRYINIIAYLGRFPARAILLSICLYRLASRLSLQWRSPVVSLYVCYH